MILSYTPLIENFPMTWHELLLGYWIIPLHDSLLKVNESYPLYLTDEYGISLLSR